MLRRDTLALTALLALLTAAGPMSVDMYLPSLPDIGRTFGAPVPQVQLTLSGFLLCFALGQIVYGPVSDHVGRRPVLKVALTLYIAASVGCALATSVEMLIVLRGVQALGVAGAPVLARAIVRDLYAGVRAGRELSRMGTIMALAPAVAPSIGGLLQTLFGWQANFYLMAAFGLYALVAVTCCCRRPGPAARGTDVVFVRPARLRQFLRHRAFRSYLAIWRPPTADCSPGFRDRRSRCRISTASRARPSASTFAAARWATGRHADCRQAGRPHRC